MEFKKGDKFRITERWAKTAKYVQMKPGDIIEFTHRTANAIAWTGTVNGVARTDVHYDEYCSEIRIRRGEWERFYDGVLCGCKKHHIDPTRDVYEQHNAWVSSMGIPCEAHEGIKGGVVVPYRTQYVAQVDDMYGSEFER